ncbi:MAG: hypothetical protein A3D87_00320 [Omnitrophica WOR_2 bacterium RIFCSPHIGHO2_02_FULL_50_17]|nr:MAG: hypothetical protein A3D87_00320 [Omnitrophica WOR_2 bacterium RIFCSPHIGHO2_02_FULL_50_17]
MNRYIKAVSFGLLIGGIVATAGWAQEAVEPAAISVSGAIVSVDAATSSLVVKDEASGDITIVADENTAFLSGDETITLSDLAQGQIVSVEYKNNNGQNIASVIEAEEAVE